MTGSGAFVRARRDATFTTDVFFIPGLICFVLDRFWGQVETLDVSLDVLTRNGTFSLLFSSFFLLTNKELDKEGLESGDWVPLLLPIYYTKKRKFDKEKGLKENKQVRFCYSA